MTMQEWLMGTVPQVPLPVWMVLLAYAALWLDHWKIAACLTGAAAVAVAIYAEPYLAALLPFAALGVIGIIESEVKDG